MKNSILCLMSVLAVFALSNAAKTITTPSGDVFVPAIDTLKTTDTVNFMIASNHNVQEVDSATYSKNGTTAKSGGFSLSLGGGKIQNLSAGTHYFVCTIHASMGMKGQLIVQSATATLPQKQNLTAYTFQVAGATPLVFQLPGETARISIVDIQGRTVWSTVTQNGSRNVSWDGKLADGSQLVAGAYFVQSTALDASHNPVGKISSAMVQIH